MSPVIWKLHGKAKDFENPDFVVGNRAEQCGFCTRSGRLLNQAAATTSCSCEAASQAHCGQHVIKPLKSSKVL